jgi:hypothetical protein
MRPVPRRGWTSEIGAFAAAARKHPSLITVMRKAVIQARLVTKASRVFRLGGNEIFGRRTAAAFWNAVPTLKPTEATTARAMAR